MKDYIQLGIEKGNGQGCSLTESFVMRLKDKHFAIEYLHVILHMKCVCKTAIHMSIEPHAELPGDMKNYYHF